MAEKKKDKVSEGKTPEVKQETPTKGREKLLEARLKTLGIDRSCLKKGKDEFIPKKFIPTGVVEVDAILGAGNGIPEGTLVEFCGEPQSGKTHLALKLMAEAQKTGKRCAYLNVENAFFPPRAEVLGVEVYNDELFELYENIELAETYGNLLISMVESQDYGVIVVDSISAMIPEVDYNKDLADNPKIGAHAMFVNRLCKKLLNLCAKTGTIVVLINQFRMGQGAMPNSMTKQATGGAAMGYFTHMRLWIKRINGAQGAVIGDGGEIVGEKRSLRVVKTRYGSPEVECVFPIFYNTVSVNPLGEFLYIAQAKGKEYIKVYRKVYQYIDKSTGEVLTSSKDPVEFTKSLMDIPAPSYKTKNDNSTNAFEYIAGRLKYNETQLKALVESLETSNEEDIDAPNDLTEVDFTEEEIETFDDDISEE